MKKDKIEKVLSNLGNVQSIKLEDCEAYNEYSVVVLYENGSDIIICENSKEANKLYYYLNEKLNEIKQENITI